LPLAKSFLRAHAASIPGFVGRYRIFIANNIRTPSGGRFSLRNTARYFSIESGDILK
jgi:hypothetical protein